MYLIIPLSILAVSVVVISVIIGRKFSYLKKLDPEVIDSNNTNGLMAVTGFWHEFLPEASDFIKGVDTSEYRKFYLSLSEKLLRRLRVVSLKIDSLTHRLITKIKSSNKAIAIVEAERERESGATPDTGVQEQDKPIIILSREEKLKQKEQELIIQIAQDPKDPELYKKLGNVYLQLKNPDDAAESFKVALKLKPDDEKTKKNLEALGQKVQNK